MPDYLVDLAAILLLPMIPAIAIYALLPSRTHVSGPFQGLTVRLAGAFAGYFLLVVVSTGFVTSAERGPRLETWTVVGRLGAAEGAMALDYNRVGFTLFPSPMRQTQRTGPEIAFHADVPVGRLGDGSLFFPFSALMIEHPGFEPESIELDQANAWADGIPVEVEEGRRRFSVDQIKLAPVRIPSSDATTVVLQP